MRTDLTGSSKGASRDKPLEPPAMDEAAFEEYLSRQSPVSQTYRDLDGDDVPSQLDEAVLGRARDALNQRSTMAATELPDELARVRNKRRRLMHGLFRQPLPPRRCWSSR